MGQQFKYINLQNKSINPMQKENVQYAKQTCENRLKMQNIDPMCHDGYVLSQPMSFEPKRTLLQTMWSVMTPMNASMLNKGK